MKANSQRSSHRDLETIARSVRMLKARHRQIAGKTLAIKRPSAHA
jgi:hypothetical protein